jgi:hypothetical protein
MAIEQRLTRLEEQYKATEERTKQLSVAVNNHTHNNKSERIAFDYV